MKRRMLPLPVVVVAVSSKLGGRKLVTASDAWSHRGKMVARGLFVGIWRQRWRHITRVVVSVVAHHKPHHLSQLEISLGDSGLIWPSRFVLDPAQALVQIAYYNHSSGEFVDPNVGVEEYLSLAEQWWAAPQEGLRWGEGSYKGMEQYLLPSPPWLRQQLRDKARELLQRPYIGPFQPEPRSNPNEGGADFGPAIGSEDALRSPMGMVVAELLASGWLARHRTVYFNASPEFCGQPDVEDLWRTRGEYYWASYAPGSDHKQPHPDYRMSEDMVEHASDWWPDGYPQISALYDVDAQHLARVSIPLILCMKAGCGFARWAAGHLWNRYAIQHLSTQDHPSNYLLRGLHGHLVRADDGEGTVAGGREWLHAWYLAMTVSARGARMFRRVYDKAHHRKTFELLADRDPNAPPWGRGPYSETDPVTFSNEVAMLGELLVRGGREAEGSALGRLVHDAQGKLKRFGDDYWASPWSQNGVMVGEPLPFLNMASGDFSADGGSASAMLQVAQTRDVLSSANPLINCPRRFYEYEEDFLA